MLINDSTRSVILGDGRQASAVVVVVVTAVATEKNYNQMHEADGRMKRTSR